MTSAGIAVCKGCKLKRDSNRVLDKSLSRKYMHKFEDKSYSHKKEIIKKSNTPGKILSFDIIKY
jgi:hypothetical protein